MKRIVIVMLVIIILIISYFFFTNNYKTNKNGNNISKSVENIENYILNISSYEATINLTVNSNKNTNKYIINQKYSNDQNVFSQEIQEPENIKGLITIYDGSSLKIENTQLGLSKLYEDYPYITNNDLCLTDFIAEYKESDKSKSYIKDEKLILEINKENKVKKLYINQEDAKPIKLEIQNINQKTSAYIEYKEIELNNTKKEEIIAFKLNLKEENI